jgi:hypothetical protein
MIKEKELELKIEELKLLRMKQQHIFRMEELNLRLELAKIYRSKKHTNKINKEIKKIGGKE